MMVAIRSRLLLLMLLSLAAGRLAAQESMMDYVMQACADDLEQYCSQVTPGDGRLLYCVAAHGDKISGQCQYALYEAAVVLADAADAIVYIAESCDTEIDVLCGDVIVGEGRLLACLEEHEAELGESCRNAVTEPSPE